MAHTLKQIIPLCCSGFFFGFCFFPRAMVAACWPHNGTGGWGSWPHACRATHSLLWLLGGRVRGRAMIFQDTMRSLHQAGKLPGFVQSWPEMQTDWNGTVKGQEGMMTGLKHSPSWLAFTPFPSPFCPISSLTACDTESCLPAWHSFFQLLPPSLKRSDQLQHPQGYRGSSGSSLSPLCHGYHRDMKKLAF